MEDKQRAGIIMRLLDLEMGANTLKHDLNYTTDENASDLEIIEAHIKKVREDQIKLLTLELEK